MSKAFYISSIIIVLIVSSILAMSEKESYLIKSKVNLNSTTDSIFSKGKTLFKSNCSSCHDIGMDKIMTAPALGGITKRRAKKWLYDYTKNSMGMYNAKDKIAVKLRNDGWALMSSFPDFTDSELDAIYYFVEERYKMSLNGIPVPIEFGFKISENKQAEACNHIISEKRDVLQVSVSKNRVWKFSCGINSHKQSDWKRTTLKEMFEFDSSINDLISMTYEFPTERKSKQSEWK